MGIAFPNVTIPDVFSGDAFSAVTLTARINNVPYTPNLLGSLGDQLYYSAGMLTTDAAIQELNGRLDVIGSSPRGSAPEQTTHPKGKLRKAPAAHIAVEDSVKADEVQNAINAAAAMGQPVLQAAEELIMDRAEGPFGLRARIELTHEYWRLGGVQGIVYDKDGSELYNWYDFFSIAPPAAHNTNFGALTAEGGAFEVECTQLVRGMTDELAGLPLINMVPVALCGDNYFDQVYSNKEVKAARKARDTGRDGDVFASNKAYKSFEYAGIVWLNYRGTKDGMVSIDTNTARLFPLGVPGLFQMLFAPPDVMGQTNMKGTPVHMYMPPERQTSKAAVVEAQSNPLPVCLRPLALFELTKS